MNAQEIMDTVKELSHSQGLYCRLYEELMDNEEVLNYLVSQNFKDSLDLIMFIEG